MSLYATPLWSHYLEDYVFVGPGLHRHGLSPEQLVTVTPAGVTPVGRDEVKQYLHVDDSDQDTVIDRLIKAATAYAQQKTGVWYAPTELEYRLMRWPFGFPSAIQLPAFPLRAVSAVSYLDRDGATQTVDAGDYELIATGSGAVVEFSQGFAYPATKVGHYPVRVRFSAGYNDPAGATGDDPALALPDAACLAIMMLAVNFFEHRGEIADNNLVAALTAADNLLAQLRVYR